MIVLINRYLYRYIFKILSKTVAGDDLGALIKIRMKSTRVAEVVDHYNSLQGALPFFAVKVRISNLIITPTNTDLRMKKAAVRQP